MWEIPQCFIGAFILLIECYELSRYIETNGEKATYKPWVWVLWLFAGPVVASFANQGYIFVAVGHNSQHTYHAAVAHPNLQTRTLVQAECILTQLIFEHALRIRVKAENGVESATSSEQSVQHTPDSFDARSTVSEEDTLLSRSQITDVTVAEGLVSQDAQSAKSDGEALKSTDSASNLVGKINNLVTTDTSNIVESRDFLFMVLYTPLQLGLATIFLYAMLGWR